MSNPLTGVQRSMSVDSALLRLIADNIANAQTPGYQRKIGIQHAEFPLTDAGVVSGKSVSSLPEALVKSALAPLSIARDSSPGTLVQTREPLDIALNGPGFLIASTPTGDVNIRGGKFDINGQGTLVTQDGNPVMGVAGPINFSGAAINRNNIEITSDGTVKLSGEIVGQLRVLPPSDPAGQSQDIVTEQVTPNVMQGFVESSNVDSVTEMLQLMEVFRHFEAGQKALRSYDGLLQQAIDDLGKI
ncbi:MAG: flagellar hook-basal body complex protein [Steroidobacter sp.]